MNNNRNIHRTKNLNEAFTDPAEFLNFFIDKRIFGGRWGLTEGRGIMTYSQGDVLLSPQKAP